MERTSFAREIKLKQLSMSCGTLNRRRVPTSETAFRSDCVIDPLFSCYHRYLVRVACHVLFSYTCYVLYAVVTLQIPGYRGWRMINQASADACSGRPIPTGEQLAFQLNADKVQSTIQSVINHLHQRLGSVIKSGYWGHHNSAHFGDLG